MAHHYSIVFLFLISVSLSASLPTSSYDNYDYDDMDMDFEELVNLTSNMTLEGEMCPPDSVQFTCVARDTENLRWSLGEIENVLVDFSYQENENASFPCDLCDKDGSCQAQKDELFHELCERNFGSIIIVNASSDGDQYNSSSYTSIFTTRPSFLNGDLERNYTSLLCGDGDEVAEISTNFSVSCGDVTLSPQVKVTSDVTSDGDTCSMELTCEGQDLSSLQWTYNTHHNITDEYHYDYHTDHLPLTLNSSVSGIEVTVETAYQEYDYIRSFNSSSTLKANVTELLSIGIRDINCGNVEKVKTVTLSRELCEVSHRAHRDHKTVIIIITCTATFLAVALIVFIFIIFCSLKHYRGKKGYIKLQDDRDKSRIKQEKTEREIAHGLGLTLWKNKYVFKGTLPDLGSRLQKYWYLMMEKGRRGGEKYIQTIAPCSKKCPLLLKDTDTVDTLNKLFNFLKHPHLHTIANIKYEASGKVSIIQPFMEQGSLRDMMFKTEPSKDWSKKYTNKALPFSTKEVARCGRHVLEAVLFLYEVGFPPLGHIQSGNIFHTDRGYVLGGYENMLLGYRTRLYKDLEKDGLLNNMIDVIMFGHVMYELASGHFLKGILPSEEEYEKVEDDRVRAMLETVIFNKKEWKGSHQKVMKKIMKDKFFNEMEVDDKCMLKLTPSPQVKQLLAVVREGKPAAVDQVKEKQS